MAKEPLKLQAYLDVPVCQVNLVNEKTVNRLKPQVEQIDGASSVFKALADDTRLKIVYALAETELCVCDVAELIGGSKATASYHLRLLHHLGM
ncbi:MAG: metalloregulator ArsR/SmtB family transcription factor, partial [Firmicutes bacterium]|nr:metalloregulator ArsR/SmtB family transcription factor [Bacillota bacterium]